MNGWEFPEFLQLIIEKEEKNIYIVSRSLKNIANVVNQTEKKKGVKNLINWLQKIFIKFVNSLNGNSVVKMVLNDWVSSEWKNVFESK